ncbi:hypothetical protein WA026_011634 [Henosepilachna vigintioctopunctata]|uniref:trypsin n=1 Tax=Henosepilachna vigintioctopunctata TaxID=420089 RepID=A0AAW1TW35_9CUCU
MCLFFNNVVFSIMVAIKMVESTSGSNRIVGGTICNIKDYPFMVSLRYTNTLQHFCGGSLIAEKWILSAAHCMKNILNTPWLLTAVLGEQRSDSTTNGQLIPARQIFNHDEFDEHSLDNDISLVLLKSEVNFIVGIFDTLDLPRSLYMPEDLTFELPGRQLIVAGWGSTEIIASSKNYTAIVSPELKCVNVSYITFEECFQLSRAATRKHICTFSKAGGEDSCIGDSGGPLFQGRTI